MTFTLETRDDFREGVFARDTHQCVFCKAPGVDAHHVLERKLWADGGYYLENGVTLCAPCHLKAEATEISCEELREKAKILAFPLPDHLYPNQRYDKWGNPILENGNRLHGELYQEEPVQKILSPLRHLFIPWVKYPRTYHLPWSPGTTSDDKTLANTEHFEGQEVVVTVKMDGEQTTMYSQHIHARSVAAAQRHPSRDWIKALHGRMGYNIPERWRVCGENLYAMHSIYYAHLREYFLIFSIWNEQNICLSWKDTEEWTALLDLTTVPVLYQGVWDERLIQSLYQERFEDDPMEGYVVRLAGEFPYRHFPNAVAKFVRENHVQTQSNWRYAPYRVNRRHRDNYITHMGGIEPEPEWEL